MDGCGVPDGAAAVELSVTVVAPVASGFLRIRPAEAPAATATFLNYTRSQSVTNTGTIPLGGVGAVKVAAFAGATHVVVDVQGYFTPLGSGSVYVPLNPCRLADTRKDGGMLVPGAARRFQLVGSGPEVAAQGGKATGCEVPADAVAAEISVSAVDSTGPGFARVWPSETAAPTATFLNYAKSQGTTNTGTIQLGGSGSVTMTVFSGAAHVVVDVQGYFTSTGSGGRYVSLAPCRVADTRFGHGDRLGAGAQREFQVVGVGRSLGAQGGKAGGCGVPAGAVASAVSISAVGPVGGGFSRVWPAGSPAPAATMVNYAHGQGITNSGKIALPASGAVALANFSGAAHYVIDVQGFFTGPPSSAPAPTAGTIDLVGDSLTAYMTWGQPWQTGAPAGSDIVLDAWNGYEFESVHQRELDRVASGRPETLVVALGTNDAGGFSGGWGSDDANQFASLIHAPHPTACVVVVTPGFVEKSGAEPHPFTRLEMLEARAVMTDIAGDMANTIVVDWHAIVGASPDLLGEDGIHLANDAPGPGQFANPEAAAARRDAIWQAVDRCH